MAVSEMKKKSELIFVPAAGIGHLASALEFTKLLINRDNHLHITVLCIKFPSIPISDSYIRSVLASQPQIQLIDLPEVQPPSQELMKSPEHYILTFMESLIPHCGWNSILESLWFGVPILTWPIYAEQQLNAFRMVREWGLAVELRLNYRRGSDIVVAEEIERGLMHLMDRDNNVHKKVKEIKEMARKAVLSGGSSFISVGKLIDNMLGIGSN